MKISDIYNKNRRTVIEAKYKILTESEIKAMMNEDKVCSKEETVQYVQSYGMLPAEELLEEAHNIIDEIWDKDKKIGVADESTYQKIVQERYKRFAEFLNNIQAHSVKVDYSKPEETKLEYSYLSEIDAAKKTIYAFEDQYFNRGVDEFPAEIYELLIQSVDCIKQTLSQHQFSAIQEWIYREAIDDSERVLKNCRVLQPLKPDIMNASPELPQD